MQNNFGHCAALVRENDRDRYLATLFAPAEHRDALFALYAFKGEISRVRELAREPMPGEIRLQWWREVLAGERTGEAAAHPVAAALKGVLARYEIGPDRLTAMIDAHAFDLYDTSLATLDDLDAYGAATESTVIAMAMAILGGRELDALTRPAGTAMAIAGLLVTLGRQVAQRQLLVPAEVLDRHKVDREDIFAGRKREAFAEALAELRRHARRQLASAAAELHAVPEKIVPALLPAATVGATLRRMEKRGYDPFRLMALSPLARQWLLWRAARDPRRIFRA